MDDSSSLLDSLRPVKEAKEDSESEVKPEEGKPEGESKTEPGAEEKAEGESKKKPKAEAEGEPETEAEKPAAKPEEKPAVKAEPDLDLDLPEIRIDPSLDIDGLRDLRQEALRQKRTLIEKKSELSAKIRDEVETTSELKKERDGLNDRVKEAKAERQKISERIKELSKQAQAFSKELEAYTGIMPTKRIREDLEKADWTYQTASLSPAKSHTIWKSIEDLSESLKRAKARDKVFSELKQRENEIGDLKKEQTAYHMSVLTHARDSEKKHKMLSDIYLRIDEIRKKRGLVNRKLQTPLEKLKAIDFEIKKRKDELAEERVETKKLHQATNSKILDKKAREVEARFKKTGKLTREDLLIIQEAELTL